MSAPIYLDNNASTALDLRVLEEMLPALRHSGNASSDHYAGWWARRASDRAREQVASLLHASPQEVVFTSGATEANNLAIKGLAASAPSQRRRIVSCRTEHPAVLQTLKAVQRSGFDVVLVDVDEFGVPDISQIRGAVDDGTLLLTVMAVNNETGVRAGLAELADIAHQVGALFHTDATQLLAWGPLDVDDSGGDLASLSAHKMHGPQGVGALYVRRDLQGHLTPLLDGGHHERGLRSGTTNTAGVVGAGAAAELAASDGPASAAATQRRRDRLHLLLEDRLGGVLLNGHPDRRAPGTLNIAIPGVEADAVMVAAAGVAMSTGSACAAGVPGPSHVLTAMGLPAERAAGSLRLSLSRCTTDDEIETAGAIITSAVETVASRQELMPS